MGGAVSYVLPLGKLEDYYGVEPSEDEVYVLRVLVTGVKFSRLSQPLEWVAALGRVFGSGKLWGLGTMAYDIRGVLINMFSMQGMPCVDAKACQKGWMTDTVCCRVLGEDQPGICYAPSACDARGAKHDAPAADDDPARVLQMDFIVTYSGDWLEESVFKKEWTIRDELNFDAKLRKLWPKMTVGGAEWKYLTGPEASDQISFWLRQPLLYDHRIGERGGLTEAYDRMQNVWIGHAEERKRQWSPPEVPSPTKPPPTEPGEKRKLEPKHVVGIVAVAAIGYFVLKGSKGARA
jgi:hypothetical protein